jgi:putative ABC transport system permease protein
MEYIIKIKKDKKNLLTDKWVWSMAWKDARNNFSRLFLFISSIVIGIAALVAISSFNNNLQEDIDGQAKELLGADYVVHANTAIEPSFMARMDTLGIEIANTSSLASMAYFMTSTSGTRLVRVVAMKGNFPFYGELETSPDSAYKVMKENGAYAMVDSNLATQYDVSTGDSIKIGNITFQYAGEVKNIPGGGAVQASFTPSIYIPMEYLDSTGLVQYGSRVNHDIFLKTQTTKIAEDIADLLKNDVKKQGHTFETVESRKENLGEAFENLYRFFNLLAFVALILGCIGVASSVHIYVKEKRATVGVLRCIGASGWQVFNIFLIQTVSLGILGSFLGVILGLGLQYSIPAILGEFIPLDINVAISWVAVSQGMLVGIVIAILFSVLPLISVRFVPPLVVLRNAMESSRKVTKTMVLTISLIVIFPLTFAAFLTKSWAVGAMFFGGLLVAFGCLALFAKFLTFLVKRFFPHGWNFIWRQSLSNLFRPNNQTTVLVVVIGLGAFLVATLSLIQNSLLNQVEFVGNENQSNTILFDIQPHQVDGVIQLVSDNNLPINQVVPIVTTRLKSLRGKTIDIIQKDTSDNIPNWALTREYRVTYRDSLHQSEKLIEGTMQREVVNSGDTIFVTISEGLKETLELEIGDRVVFDVQGIPIITYIGGVRDVEWSNDPPNFIFVFPKGVLEPAPKIFVLTTKTTDKATAGVFQRELITAFPNVSAIDLNIILETLQTFFDKVAFVIRFMALFSIITGLVVLAGAVINSKYLRMKENVLLRTLGALKKQIVAMTLIEYGYLGFFAGLTGVGLSVISGWGLATFFFEVKFSPDYLSLLGVWGVVILLTMIVGWWNTRDVVNSSPLEILRREVL